MPERRSEAVVAQSFIACNRSQSTRGRDEGGRSRPPPNPANTHAAPPTVWRAVDLVQLVSRKQIEIATTMTSPCPHRPAQTLTSTHSSGRVSAAWMKHSLKHTHTFMDDAHPPVASWVSLWRRASHLRVQKKIVMTTALTSAA